MTTKQFDDFEKELLGAINTLDRIEEFTLPSETPNNQGLAVNM